MNSELIVDGYSGYLADSRNIEDIKTKDRKITSQKSQGLCQKTYLK